jgi:hypothetical protein
MAWGIGFQYAYDPAVGILDIIDAKKAKPLIYVDFDRKLSRDTLAYVQFFEKATQINALIFSNNNTLDLSETFDDKRLVAILEDSAKLARYALDLKRRKFKKFCEDFCQEYELHTMEIKRIGGRVPGTAFYTAMIRTKNLNEISVRSPSVSRIMTMLSDKTMQDLLTVEFGHHLGTSAHTLLTASSKLSALGRILDSEFNPENVIEAAQHRRLAHSA